MLTLSTSGGLYGNHSFLRSTNVFARLVSPKSHNFTREKSDLNTLKIIVQSQRPIPKHFGIDLKDFLSKED